MIKEHIHFLLSYYGPVTRKYEVSLLSYSVSIRSGIIPWGVYTIPLMIRGAKKRKLI